MKRTNFVTNLISILLFVAVLAYIGFYVVGQLRDELRTAPVVQVVLEDTVPLSGLVVRSEQLLESSQSFVSVSVRDGQLVAAGETLAVAYSGESALARARLLQEKLLQQQYISSVLSEQVSGEDARAREGQIKSAVTALAAASARGQAQELPRAAMELSSLIITGALTASQETLDALTREIESLSAQSEADIVPITAPQSGLFFSSADGYENLTPESVMTLSPEALRTLLGAPRSAPEDVLGKLASPLEWYYAALVPFETAQRLEVGGSVNLAFARYRQQSMKAMVVSINYHADNECAVVFRCTVAAADLLYARLSNAELVFDTTSGLRVPKEAVFEETIEEENAETGETASTVRHFVYTATGLQAEKKYIEIVWEGEDFCLAAVQPEPGSLREGNDIILGGDELYDGMLLR
ncbi:MAG: hypothetical protein LBM18_03365 [Oscillospiraceae bacterium]|jgi:hypothetical protein|nr:hypothetical protein [Oscillospiraceae bacterium]